MSDERVGTLAEEAARLLAALQTWAGDSTPQAASAHARDGGVDADDVDADCDDSDGDDSDGDHSDHEARHETHGADECRWCPLCRVARVARSASPDVRAHLSQAALSLALAVKGLLEEPDETARRAAPVEKIDLTDLTEE